MEGINVTEQDIVRIMRIQALNRMPQYYQSDEESFQIIQPYDAILHDIISFPLANISKIIYSWTEIFINSKRWKNK